MREVRGARVDLGPRPRSHLEAPPMSDCQKVQLGYHLLRGTQKKPHRIVNTGGAKGLRLSDSEAGAFASLSLGRRSNPEE